ncbi:MAG: ferrous iron transport protein B [Flavobacteriaceae bacterium]|nr:ferrous iron transport protein B [Flavobacteriaceae bacterium]MBT7458907.1 ferrous iron transport protein B [Flavobacteriaceae bacterium]MDG0968021.1 ferrous iron transport protein B [Flavobacteriaceae bacterium]
MKKRINVALIGNPNTGKSSVFNLLTGLQQKTGNYPGITVEKKEGVCRLSKGLSAKVFDLPGTYSLNASSLDENVVIELLLNRKHEDYPDVAVIVADIENLKRNLLLFTQIKDLAIPSILVVNMSDRMRRKGITLDLAGMEKALNTKIVLTSTLRKEGIDQLKSHIADFAHLETSPCVDFRTTDPEYFAALQQTFPNQSIYKLWLVITQDVNFANINRNTIQKTNGDHTRSNSFLKRLQQRETIKRYQFINEVLKKHLHVNQSEATDFQSRLDRILTHKFWGYIIFFIILFTIFQAIYDWSSYPMDAIDSAFVSMSEWTKTNLPSWFLPKLISEGVIPGLGGVAIFIPQIAILFVFISILEETGYMSRVVFLMDRVLRKFGLSGKSVVPLISGTACAIPAIMATRNIESWKERLITILVTPFTTCSARLPVYLILIALVIPDTRFLGANMQGLVLMGLYLLGFGMALAAAYVLQFVLKLPYKSAFVVEMPNYRIPILRNVGITVYNKTKSFVFEAGKIILAISVLLWVLASNGPGSSFGNAEEIVRQDTTLLNQAELEQKISAYKLEHSYLGRAGKFIEPAIAPLGYDWKIGIAIVSSFAAREVFVGTLATIYNVGTDEEDTIKNRMADEVHPDGKPVFTLASGMSLMIFYAFAMQCMSTLAIVRKETNSWRWPTIQLVVMTVIAYLAAFATFQLL